MTRMAPVSVLVVDAHPMMHEALCAAISLEPDLALIEPDASGTLMLSILQEPIFLSCIPDVILLALGNSGLEELESLKAIRNQLPGVVILALVTNEVPGQEQAALAMGADAILSKAVSRDKLLGALRESWMAVSLGRGEEDNNDHGNGNSNEEV